MFVVDLYAGDERIKQYPTATADEAHDWAANFDDEDSFSTEVFELERVERID